MVLSLSCHIIIILYLYVYLIRFSIYCFYLCDDSVIFVLFFTIQIIVIIYFIVVVNILKTRRLLNNFIETLIFRQ